jgi:hypothetical protein
LLGLALVLGFFTRVAALLSGLLLLWFALTMTFALGVKAPLDFSLFSTSAGAFLLAAYGKYPVSIDALTLRGRFARQPTSCNVAFRSAKGTFFRGAKDDDQRHDMS